MDDTADGVPAPDVEPLDDTTREQWVALAAETVRASTASAREEVNARLDRARQSDSQSPVAPAYGLWLGDSLARAGRYVDAIRSFDAAVETAQGAPRLAAEVDATSCSLIHKAQAARLAGDRNTAVATYRELASVTGSGPDPLFQAGLVAEAGGDDDEAAGLYRRAQRDAPSSRTDDPAELARRALLRMQDASAVYFPTAGALAEVLTDALENRDLGELDRLISTTHFAVGLVGGHTVFEEPGLREELARDLLDSSVRARPHMVGTGDKRYLTSTGWRGDWFRGEVVCLLTHAPKGWQWTGVALTQSHERWAERWRPATIETNQPLPIPLLAPWPAGQSFKAGGLNDFIAQQAAIVAAGPILGGALALGFSRNPCGFGPRGFYYNQGSTHQGENAFAIDFTRYERNVPYDPESGGTRVLATRDGIVARVSAGTPSGDSSASNTVEIVHADPGNATDVTRFRSRYLHMEGPFRIAVSAMMPVIGGQRLGLMDDTGNSVLDHLHFSVHDRSLAHPNVSYGRSVRPSPLSGVRLGDGDSGRCVRSTNVERFPGLNFLPPLANFGSVGLGESRTLTITAENTVGRTISMSFPASPSGSVFIWGAFSASLADKARTAFTVRFQPRSNAIERGQLLVTSTAPGNPQRLGLIGKGIGGFPPPPPEPPLPEALEFSPVPVTFGSVAVGSVARRVLTIANRTGTSVAISYPASAPGSVFSWQAFSGILANGTERRVDLTFRPTSNAIERATLTVTSDTTASPNTIGLVGKGPGGFPIPQPADEPRGT